MTALRTEGVVVRFGGLTALAGLSIEAGQNEITGLIGPNGAGKTTFFDVCSGFRRPDEGTVVLAGIDVTHEPPSTRARQGLGRTFQRMELFRSMTVRENVELAAEATFIDDNPLTLLGLAHAGRAARASISETADSILADVGLVGVAGKVAGEISTGQSRLLELARALARRPSFLLLDEPSSGLDIAETASFAELLVELVRTTGVGVLLVEHDMSLVLGVCAQVYVLDFGKLIFTGNAAEVRSSEVVKTAYLGRSAA